jgi:acyl-CoA thioesterase-1
MDLGFVMLFKFSHYTRSLVVLPISACIAFACIPQIVSAEQTIIVIGDSLSSGYGLRSESSWVTLLQDRMIEEGYGYEIVNASVPGDTSSGGLARLPKLLENYSPAIVIIELGGNDGLLGHSVELLRDNLSAMLSLIQAKGVMPILTGIQIPPNYGNAYASRFAFTYPELSQEFSVPLVEFLMQGVALNPDLMQSDGIHPNESGNRVMMEHVWTVLVEFL